MEARATADGSRTLTDPASGETYHSQRGALTEARHVFLAASGVAERLRAGRPTTVLEVGFGAGLNFLVSAAEAAVHATPLLYHALERDLLDAATLAGLDYGGALGEPDLVAAWLELLAPHAGRSGVRVRLAREPVTLVLHLGDARAAELPEGVHAVFHDAFSPAVNPALWDGAFLARLAACLAPGGALVSYSVKGAVRRDLAALGLEVAKLPGPPGGKREMLRALRPPASRGATTP